MMKITVEPVLLLTMLLVVIYSIVSKEYIYHRLATDYGLINGTKLAPCANKQNISKDVMKLQEEVNALSSSWTLYLNVAGFIPSLLTTNLLGAWGDIAGRKLPLLFSCFGLLMMIIVYIIVIHFELHVEYLLIARLVGGLFGDVPVVLSSSFAYLSDITTHESRTLRLAVGEACLALGGVIGSLTCSVWVDAQGYENPLWLLVASMIFCLLYITFVMSESVILSSDSLLWKLRKLFSFEPFRGLWQFLKVDLDRTKKIGAITFCFFLSEAVYAGIPDVLILIELSFPLCFTNSLVGYATTCITASAVCGLVFLKLVTGKLNEFILVTLAIISSTVSLIVCSFAHTEALLFTGICLGLLQGITIVVCRSVVSRLVDSSEQGSLFALFACGQSFANIAATLIFNGIYSATVATVPSTVFFVAMGMNLLIVSVFGLSYRSVRHDLKAKAYMTYEAVDEVSASVET